jgi:hypothetical protein
MWRRRLAVVMGAFLCLPMFAASEPLPGVAPTNLPRLWAGNGDAAGIVYDDLAPNQPTTVGDLGVCVDRVGSVEIEKIESEEAFGRLRLEQFGVVPTTDIQGDKEGHRAIADYGINVHRPVVLEGPSPRRSAELKARDTRRGSIGYCCSIRGRSSRPRAIAAFTSGICRVGTDSQSL